jgi:DNA-binding NarL/FixJ family response regulator
MHPDVLVTDLMIPRLHGLDVVRQVKERSPETRIVVLSMRGEPASIAEAMHNGAMAYVSKESTANDLLDALKEVSAGRRYLSPILRDKLPEGLAGIGKDSQPKDVSETLTSRERQILQMAAEGLSSSEIALKLFISVRTAETHRANIMGKLNLKSQTDLVRFAIRKGIISA